MNSVFGLFNRLAHFYFYFFQVHQFFELCFFFFFKLKKSLYAKKKK